MWESLGRRGRRECSTHALGIRPDPVGTVPEARFEVQEGEWMVPTAVHLRLRGIRSGAGPAAGESKPASNGRAMNGAAEAEDQRG